MRTRAVRVMLVLAGAALLLAVAFVAGRSSAPAGPVRTAGTTGDYLSGLAAGEALGMREGRALQAAAGVPAASRQPVRDAFDAGYVAGANDVFSGYDGGWLTGAPYVVTLAPGQGRLTYRVATRTQLQPGTAYSLCPDGHGVCPTPARTAGAARMGG